MKLKDWIYENAMLIATDCILITIMIVYGFAHEGYI